MKIISTKYVISVANITQIPLNGYPEIAFAGRSNVGKSSLLNCLINRKRLALTSSSPGKTRLINYFEINSDTFLVDLPGYGYAKVSQDERNRWKKLIESYITKSRHLKGIIQIIDSRIGPTDLDMEMISWLIYLQKPMLIVATKTDKLPKSKIKNLLLKYSQKIETIAKLDILPFSAKNKTGRKEVWKTIHSLIKEK